jgi:hypothetical protein
LAATVKRFLAETDGVVDDIIGITMMIAVGLTFVFLLVPYIVVLQTQFSISSGISEAARAGSNFLFPTQQSSAQAESQAVFDSQIVGQRTACGPLSYSQPTQGGQYYKTTVTCTTSFAFYHATHTFSAGVKISNYQGVGQS